jgi:hypothetical protein
MPSRKQRDVSLEHHAVLSFDSSTKRKEFVKIVLKFYRCHAVFLLVVSHTAWYNSNNERRV